jgi:tripartite-type tricarboxylate transporter receptor subunit TctC
MTNIGINRRAILLLAGALASPTLVRAQTSEEWPARPIRVIVPFAPGGATDSTLRIIADRLGPILGQSIVVDNRSGGGATIGGGVVAQSEPDGYTLLFDGYPVVTNPLLMPDLPFDYNTAFVPVTQAARVPLAVGVKADLPAKTLVELVELAKSRPGTLSCGYSGNGTGAQLAFLLLEQRTGMDLVEVPYRGGGDAVRDLASGTLDCATLALLSMLPMVSAGKVRVLAVTSPSRTPLMPEVPTLVESGYADAALEEWLGLFAPTGTPAPIVARLQAATAEALRDPAVKERLAQLGSEPVGSTPMEFAAFMKERAAQAEQSLRQAGKLAVR